MAMDEDDNSLVGVIDSLTSAGITTYAISQQPAQPVRTVGAGSLVGTSTGGGSSFLLFIIVVIAGWFAYKALK